MSKTTIAVDAARLPILLTELRLPTFARMWPSLAETADAESWPAARFLAALAEHEVAERLQRRIARHAQESRLPPGKTFEAFDFAAVPMIGKARFLALADPGSSAGRTSCCSAHPASPTAISGPLSVMRQWLPRALRPHDRSPPEAAIRPLGADPRRRHREARQVSPPDPRRSLLRAKEPGRDQRPLRADCHPLRAPIHAHHRQLALQGLGFHGIP